MKNTLRVLRMSFKYYLSKFIYPRSSQRFLGVFEGQTMDVLVLFFEYFFARNANVKEAKKPL
jgi:hypothetical protein